MFGFQINPASPSPNGKQLENQIRDAILKGSMNAGAQLPPTRSLAKELQIARNTVIQAYEQLIAEGYLISREGAGTFVAELGKLPKPKAPSEHLRKIPPERRDVIAFDAGDIDRGSFPKIQFARLMRDAFYEVDENTFSYAYYTGHPKLKKAIRSYLYRMKGIECSEEQIVITAGTAGGMEILAKVFEQKGNRIILEDPCISFVKKIFTDHNYELCPLEVDSQGMKVGILNNMKRAELIYVVPSHQFPLGGVLPASRRIALLQYASEQNAYILEDDYDSEFRYRGEALQALHNLDRDRVIYLGSFSKIFAPSLRLGYMILPHPLCEQVEEQISSYNLWAGPFEQLALAEFLEQKLMDKHIYKMRKLYEIKRKHLILSLMKTFGSQITISGEDAGLHLLVSFHRELTQKDLQSFAEQGVEVDYVEEYATVKGKHNNRIVLGYGGLTLAQIEEGVRRLQSALRL